MVHVNLTITGEIGDVVQIIRNLAPRSPTLVPPPVVEPQPEPISVPEPQPLPAPPVLPVAPEAETGIAGWTPDKAATLMNGITADAALVVLYLAQRSPSEATPDQIRADLQFEPRQLTNALISVGNRASRNGLPTPAVIKKGNTLRIQNDLVQALTAHENDTTATPRSQRNAEWFDVNR